MKALTLIIPFLLLFSACNLQREYQQSLQLINNSLTRLPFAQSQIVLDAAKGIREIEDLHPNTEVKINSLDISFRWEGDSISFNYRDVSFWVLEDDSLHFENLEIYSDYHRFFPDSLLGTVTIEYRIPHLDVENCVDAGYELIKYQLDLNKPFLVCKAKGLD